MPAHQWLEPHDPVIAAIALRDDDVAVLELAGTLAEVAGAPLILAHAFPYQQLVPLPGPPSWADDMRASAETELRELAARLPADIAVTTQSKANPSAVRALHETAEETGASLIVAGSSHRSALGQVLPGGVGERLLHASPCCVAIAPRGYARPAAGLRRIGVAFVDGPEGADALDLASRLAARSGALVTTYTVIGSELADAESAVRRARAAVPAEQLDDALVLVGDPATELAIVSLTLDLLICGSRGYGPVRSLVVGGVSWELAHRARCPLLVVPRGASE